MSYGFEDMVNKLNQMQRNIESLGGTHSIPFDELFDQNFLLDHTSGTFSAFDDFFKAGKFGKLTFKEVPDDEWDKWVKKSTDFNSWSEMQMSATQAYVAKKIGF
ncbi:hypothetical protein [Limosilactobacillus gorillae]|jgi:hypothetical protein|uniref:hypothetical protein n=1 Tax=Limosilactobacillus gorillae TaxID=1450649 RepID=UPI000AB384AF|nr:hypothetical protein [Limosilactobacillus gorillae]